ncbi:hypothetical protein KH0195_00920 [Helicobacter pylori]
MKIKTLFCKKIKKLKNQQKKKINPQKRGFKKTKGSKKETPQKRKGSKKKPLKKGSFTKSLVSEHIIQIHAIESAVFEFSPHKGIVIGVNGRDFKP